MKLYLNTCGVTVRFQEATKDHRLRDAFMPAHYSILHPAFNKKYFRLLLFAPAYKTYSESQMGANLTEFYPLQHRVFF